MIKFYVLLTSECFQNGLRLENLKRFRLREQIEKPQVFHYARSCFDEGILGPAHSHDYYEIFFIESGEGTHHVNGRTQVLTRGSLVFIRPERDIHAFSGHALVKLTIAFPRSVFSHLCERYFGGNASFYGREKMPRLISLDRRGYERFLSFVEKLDRLRRDLRTLETCLLNLFDAFCIARESKPFSKKMSADEDWPDWVKKGLKEIAKPEHFQRGTRGLAALAGKNAAYVSREIRKWTLKSPRDWVTEARLDYAAKELELGEKDILSIALDCGYRNLAHFYKLFQKRFGMTPWRFRRSSRLIGGRRVVSGELPPDPA